MPTFADIEGLPSGARFYRADLHIHSFGASHDVKDATMTPGAIVTAAIAENLDLIAIADHNDIGSVEQAIKAAEHSSLLVLPAVELSTPEGHLLCFLSDFDTLSKFTARLTIVDKGLATSRCQNAMLDCLKQLEQLGGFAVLAHVDAKDAFGDPQHGSSPHRLDILCHPNLLGIEVLDATSPISYSKTDPEQARVQAGEERIKRLALGTQQYLGRILSSDAHTLARLGHNARGDRKVTRVKMDRPSFDALRIALHDADARVRVEDHIPSTIPHVAGVHFGGGFLDGESIHFSKNLNCIIGGRGTGKSTAFEVVRCLEGKPSDSPLVDSEVWPGTLTLFWRDQAEQLHTLSRAFEDDLRNLDDPVNGPDAFPIESYGQGETARISKEAQDNPLALLSYLDRFVDIDEPRAEEDSARDELLMIQTDIEKAQRNVDAIPQTERALTTTQQQLAALEKAKAQEIIELQRRLAEEREIRAQVANKLGEIKDALSDSTVKDLVEQIGDLGDPNLLVVGSAEFKEIVAKVRLFEGEASRAQGDTKDVFNKLEAAADVQLAAWKGKESEIQKTIEAKRKALEDQNIRLDMAYIQKLAKDEAKLKADLVNLKTWKPRLDELLRKRAAVSKKRWTARERVATLRDTFGRAASDTLKDALSGDLLVTLKFQRSAYSPDAEQHIIQAMGWRTIQIPRAALSIQRLTLPGLLEAIDRGDVTSVTNIATDQGGKLFDKAEAERIVERLREPATRFALERCEVHDLPRLTVTKTVTDMSGTVQYLKKTFSQLSLGQQQSVLLALMLSSRSTAPLIIDQPEDNLDGEFIYHTLVPVLRRAKERRQVIVVTHNANIAVLGDAEQIIVLKSTNERGRVVSRGSIDDGTTRDAACAILEGAKEAFRRRARIYGSL
jgi:ABC-type lipoprotein export system ATPase subunit